MAGGVTYLLENVNKYWILPGRAEERRPLGRRRRGLDDNIKMDLQGEEWFCIDLIDLTMDRDGC